MDRLPYDYARCINGACPLRDRCLRATPGRSDGRQAFAAYPGGEGCHGLIEAAP